MTAVARARPTRMTDKQIADKLGIEEVSVSFSRMNFAKSEKLGPDGFAKNLPPETQKTESRGTSC
jgi:FixJ family two-component response regulator